MSNQILHCSFEEHLPSLQTLFFLRALLAWMISSGWRRTNEFTNPRVIGAWNWLMQSSLISFLVPAVLLSAFGLIQSRICCSWSDWKSLSMNINDDNENHRKLWK
jgi:hypothetical protein